MLTITFTKKVTIFGNLKFRMENLRLENFHRTYNNFAFDLDERQIRMIKGNYKMIKSVALVSNEFLVVQRGCIFRVYLRQNYILVLYV